MCLRCWGLTGLLCCAEGSQTTLHGLGFTVAVHLTKWFYHVLRFYLLKWKTVSQVIASPPTKWPFQQDNSTCLMDCLRLLVIPGLSCCTLLRPKSASCQICFCSEPPVRWNKVARVSPGFDRFLQRQSGRLLVCASYVPANQQHASCTHGGEGPLTAMKE